MSTDVRPVLQVDPLVEDAATPFDRRWYEDSFQYFLSLGYAF